MVTINDIAKHLGVAKSTVSNALTGRRYVNPELKERILNTVKEMEFEPNFFASTLSNKKMTNIIGLFLELGEHNVYQSFYHQLIESCITEAALHDYQVLVYFGMNHKQAASLLKIGKSPIDCAIVLSPELEDTRAKQIQASSIPNVYIGKPDKASLDVNTVDTDNEGLLHSILNKLYELGHRHILFINSKKDLTVSKERYDAYMNAYHTGKFKGNDPIHVNAMDSTVQEGYDFIKELIEKKRVTFTAVITANDLLAKGVYDYLNEKEIKVGEDISVIALGGDVFIETLKPALSYAYQDYLAIGKKATSIILNQIKTGDFTPVQFEIKSHVHYLESIQKVKKS